MVLDELKDTTYELFTDFKVNPTVTNVKDGVKAFKEAKADFVIAMGVDTTGMSIDEAAHAAVEAVRKLSLDLGILQTLRELKIPENALPQLANDAINDAAPAGTREPSLKKTSLNSIKKPINRPFLKKL